MKRIQKSNKAGPNKPKSHTRQPLKEISISVPITDYTVPRHSRNKSEEPQNGLDETITWGKLPKVSKKLSSPIALKPRSSSRCVKLRSERELCNGLVQTSLLSQLSARKSKRIMEAEKKKTNVDALIQTLEANEEDGLEIRTLLEKGRAVFTTRAFISGDYICEYVGELISNTKALQREMEYSEDVLKGCYMYYFRHKKTKHCIDATEETGRFGRIINHSRIRYNLKPRVIEGDTIHLCFFATRNLESGEELLYDYGDQSRESVKYFPWLKT